PSPGVAATPWASRPAVDLPERGPPPAAATLGSPLPPLPARLRLAVPAVPPPLAEGCPPAPPRPLSAMADEPADVAVRPLPSPVGADCSPAELPFTATAETSGPAAGPSGTP